MKKQANDLKDLVQRIYTNGRRYMKICIAIFQGNANQYHKNI
jgi:hypothetical protein